MLEFPKPADWHPRVGREGEFLPVLLLFNYLLCCLFFMPSDMFFLALQGVCRSSASKLEIYSGLLGKRGSSLCKLIVLRPGQHRRHSIARWKANVKGYRMSEVCVRAIGISVANSHFLED